jgi:hypothetical protein
VVSELDTQVNSIEELQRRLSVVADRLAFGGFVVPPSERKAARIYAAYVEQLRERQAFCHELLNIALDSSMTGEEIRRHLAPVLDNHKWPSPVSEGRHHWETILAAVLLGLQATLPTVSRNGWVEFIVTASSSVGADPVRIQQEAVCGAE